MKLQNSIGSPCSNQLVDLETIYVHHFAERFTTALENLQSCTESIHLNIDCAHGVGSKVLERFRAYFSSVKGPRRLILHLYNTETEKKELLNQNCGADFVKVSYLYVLFCFLRTIFSKNHICILCNKPH